jgi:hypothetical protein
MHKYHYMNLKLRWLLLVLLLSSSVFSQSYNNEWIDYNKTYYKFKVYGFGTDAAGSPIRQGMVRIPYSSLAAAGLGAVPAGQFQLWRDGAEVPVYVSATSALGASDYIEFWGEINTGKLDKQLYSNSDYQLSDKWSLQTDTAAYFLTVNTTGTNKRLTSVANNVAGTTLTPEQYFTHAVGRYYRASLSDGFYASFGQNLYSSSYDKGEGWISRTVRPVACSNPTSLPQTFTDLQPYLAGPAMTMKLNAVGAAQNSRVVKVTLNNDSVTLFQMDYLNYEKVQEQVPVSLLAPGYAAFSVIDKSSNDCDEMKVAMIELTYPRQFNFSNASVFNFSVNASASGRFLKITNFNYGAAQPVLYDIANGKRYLVDVTNADTLQVVLQPSTTAYNLVLTTQAGTSYLAVQNLESRTFTNYISIPNQGNYLIISNPLIYGSGSQNYVQQYKQYRSSAAGGGYTAQVIDVNDLVDQFAWGIKKHPLAIKNFLRYARTKFTAAPKFAFIIGKGITYNAYRENENDPLIEQLNLVPTWGNPASDNILASNDFKAIPATPIGRLSAVTPQEVGDYLKKVKQYDSAQVSNTHSLEDKAWMKNVLQIAGANDLTIGAQLDGYLNGYKDIISDTSYGGNVTNFSKTANPAGYADAIVSFEHSYNKGASLITYFGHSSASSLDFNLDNPENYNNANRYPIFIANGCSAGNNFEYEPNRFNAKSTISEKFVLAPGKGAIGYLASTHFGVVNYLNLYTRQFYKAIAKTKYGASVGEIIKEGITRSLDSTGTTDYYSRVHAETFAWHGDPAIHFNTFLLPDYVVEEPEMLVSPSFNSVADTSLFIKVRLHNVGRLVNDSVTFKLDRKLPDGTVIPVTAKMLPPIKFADSVTIEVPVISNRDKGANVFTATVNYTNSVTELSVTNNVADKTVIISEDEIRPVYPYNYAIIDQPTALLSASTVNPLNAVRSYIMEIDTTVLFNSPSKIARADTSAGGIIQFDPGFTFQDSTTYYWRVTPAGLSQPNWRQFSFVYKANTTGFQQGHLYQHLQSQYSNIIKDSVSGRNKYSDQNHNLFITNAIYPTSGTEDSHFSISVDGSTYIRSACLGSSIIINVFDSLTFLPWANVTNPFGAAPNCLAGREHNFEYGYRIPAERKSAMDFLDSIPSGAFVSVRLILDQPYNVYAPDWATDTSLYGSNNSLYHRLKDQGFAGLDSFYFPRTWAFVYQKNKPSFQPEYAFSAGVSDKVILSKNATTPHINGYITSPQFGPASQWGRVKWKGFSEEAGNDDPTVDVVGIDSNKNELVLFTLNASQQDFDVSSVSATLYPYMKLRMKNEDTITATPYQLTQWQVEYASVREGAIAPNLYFAVQDSIGIHGVRNDTLHVGVAFKNVSKIAFDSVEVKVLLIDAANNIYNFGSKKLRPLPAGDTVHLDTDLDVHGLVGRYNLYVEFNPGLKQKEQYSFNNFLYKSVFIGSGAVLPVNLLDFTARLKGKDVQTNWSVTSEVNTKYYVVQHSIDGYTFSTVGTVTASNAAAGKYAFTHANAPKGKNYYRLQMFDKNGTYTYSPTRLVNIGEQLMVNIYPNPVRDKLSIVVNKPGGSNVELRILNAVGQLVWQQNSSGSLEVDVSSWAGGIYLLQVKDGKSVITYKLQKQ